MARIPLSSRLKPALSRALSLAFWACWLFVLFASALMTALLTPGDLFCLLGRCS